MPDVFTKRKRSEVMSRIRGRGNKDTELALAKLLRANRITGWRRQQGLRIEGTKRRAGTARPTNVGIDFVFPKQRVAVFVDGCFWHGCPKHSSPKKWLKKSSMGEGQKSGVSYPFRGVRARSQPSALSGQPAVVRERGATSYQPSAISSQPPLVRERSTNSYQVRTGNRELRTGPSTTLRTGKQFWREKLAANIARDRFVNRKLRKQGWKVVRIWEHELGRGSHQLSAFSSQPVVEKIRRAMAKGDA
ncbi:MAG TPA: hypothetical protein VL486_05265 [Verrucomicrobiae bacterium]|nr:hypothetical protein [Verrucomicrobiae bacterium]